MTAKMAPLDGNSAVAKVAHAVSEVCAIYPITPSSSMGELADALSAAGETNIWGTVPTISELQSEAGASGSVHGATTAGAITSTFTASQGLLLMIPNMYKMAGELSPVTFHVSARSVATHALSIFGDHSDVMAVRGTGFALLAAASVQEAQDMALIATAAALESRIPFLHFFDGFRTSHEIQKITLIDKDQIKQVMKDDAVLAHRARGLTPDRPMIRGTAQNPDVFMQSREACQPFYDATPDIVEKVMDRFAKVTGRQYKPFDYVGHPEAERVIVIMGSGADTAEATTRYLQEAEGEKLGVLKVHLYRPWSIKHFIAALPSTARKFAVLERTKEPGAVGEPMYEDVRTAFGEAMQEDSSLFDGHWPVVVGGRYGLSSKEFTPAMVKAVYENLATDKPKNHFTVGINDDVSNSSLTVDTEWDIETDAVSRCMFYGLGSDGTVGANKNSIKIIGDNTGNYAQGYFVYDSKKAGAVTVSHLRFGPDAILNTYLVSSANFVACHQWFFLEKYDMLRNLNKGGVFLLNSIYGKDETWNRLPKRVQQQIIDKEAQFYVIDAYDVGEKTGMGVRINTIMQTCFFAISGVIPKDQAIEYIKGAIKKTYSKKGEDVVRKNYAAVDATLEHLHQVDYPKDATSAIEMPPAVGEDAPEFVRNVTAEILAGRGADLPVSAMPVDGTFPTATTQYEKRNIALHIPVWEPDLCIQCGKCSAVCPHAVIRMKLYDADAAKGAPETFKSCDARGGKVKGMKCTIQVFPEDCTGCGGCVATCPAKDKENPERKAINMADQAPLRLSERENAAFFLTIPETARGLFPITSVKGSQLCKPLFEFNGACAGCGETPYVKLMSQLFGDRVLAANATGCSSIYGGNLPTTPYCVDKNGRGPAWSNSLFEDAAEFGFGMRLATDKFEAMARELLQSDNACVKKNAALCKEILDATQGTQEEIDAQRDRVAKLKDVIKGCSDACCKQLMSLADYLVKKSVWIIGGDGWAYDIGYGGLDHVLASGRNVNVLMMDTEVYSNTGGQASKATPIGAVARFAEGGKALGKKDLALMAMTYGNVYVAKVAMGANDGQCVKAFVEAESYDGPSLIMAYSHCIAHGIRDMADGKGKGFAEQKGAVACGHWPLIRFDPRAIAEGKNPLTIDSKAPTISYADWALNETRFQSLKKRDPERADALLALGDEQIQMRWQLYQQLAGVQLGAPEAVAST